MSGWSTRIDRERDRDAEQAEVDDVLALVGDRPLRQHFLQFARGHQAAGEGEGAENHLQRPAPTITNARNVRGARR